MRDVATPDEGGVDEGATGNRLIQAMRRSCSPWILLGSWLLVISVFALVQVPLELVGVQFGPLDAYLWIGFGGMLVLYILIPGLAVIHLACCRTRRALIHVLLASATGVIGVQGVWLITDAMWRETKVRGSEIAEGLVRYREAHGVFPNGLRQLVGTEFDSLPLMPFLGLRWYYSTRSPDDFDLRYYYAWRQGWVIDQDLEWEHYNG